MFKDKQTISVKLGNWIEAKATGAFSVAVVLTIVLAGLLVLFGGNSLIQ